MTHLQYFCTFSVNKEVLQDNLQETSLTSQRLVYDTLQSNNRKPQ